MKAVFVSTILVFLVTIAGISQEVPVSDRDFNNSDATFRFAIVSDRTGGMRGGIFADAINKVEMLQPEFVISVGDLIDGYTEDPEVWNAQWDEFDAIIENLSMPFYYVPGNHDTSNELLTEVWRARHGRDYYYFVYKDVLFLSLNTDEVNGGGISEEQVKYFEEVLNENEDVKWTLLFMHRPVWSYGERMGYDGIEEALGERKYTLFSGHHHHYRYKVHNGMEHFTLATTGGGSWMRNPDVGELDHITWVTMQETGPEVAHIDIKGIYGKDLVPEKDYEDIQVVRRGDWLQVKPLVYESETFKRIPVTLTLTNNSKRFFNISGELNDQHGIRFEPSSIKERLEPDSTSIEITIDAVSISGESSIPDLNNSPLILEMNAGFERELRNDISLSTSKVFFLDWQHQLRPTSTPITIDGDLSDWPKEDMIDVRNPQFVKEDWDWYGQEDGRFEFGVRYDKQNLYLAIKFYDETRHVNTSEILERQDKFFIHLDKDLDPSEFETIELAIGSKADSPLINLDETSLKSLIAAIDGRSTIQMLEVAVPISELLGDKKEASEFIRINIGIMDHDRPENTKPSILWWRPVWGSDQDYENSGVFFLKED